MSDKTKTYIVIGLLILSFVMPILGFMGVLLMWYWMKWSKVVKVLITIPLIILPFVILPIFTATYLFIARPFQVFGNAMHPAFSEGEYLLAKPIKPVEKINRGDVLVFKNPVRKEYDYLSRIVGLPEEKLYIDEGLVYINGQVLDESNYLNPEIQTLGKDNFIEKKEITIPDNKYFVMGDNREHSEDSRNFGVVPREDFESKILFCYWNCK